MSSIFCFVQTYSNLTN